MRDKLYDNLGQQIQFLEKQIQTHNDQYPDQQINLEAEFAFGGDIRGSVNPNFSNL